MSASELKVRTRRRTGITISLAMVAATASALAVAGPFCGNGNRGGPGMQAYSPMGPGPQAYYGGPMRGMNTMGAPGGWRMPAYGNNTGGYAAQAMPAPATTPQPQTVMSRDKQAPAADAITVRIDGMRFEPATIKVKPGTTVTWVQNSSMPHTVNGGMDNMRSSTLYNGQSYSFTFDETGSFDYVCDFHPSMKGSVIVEEAGTRT